MGRTVALLDPGPERTALLAYRGGVPVGPLVVERVPGRGTLMARNAEVVLRLREGHCGATTVIIERVMPYGRVIGQETIDTARWVGRYQEASESRGIGVVLMPRRDVRRALELPPTAGDAMVRQAVIDHYGGRERAIGRKRDPGPCYGLVADLWQALALGVAYERMVEDGR